MNEEINKLIKKAYSIQKEKNLVEKEINKLKERLTELDASYNAAKDILMSAMVSSNLLESMDQESGVSATICTKESVNYSDEDAVISYLKENGYSDCINVKESIAKKELNKQLKLNEDLKSELNAFLVTNVTEYLTIMDEHARNSMNEAINNKSKK